MNIDAPAFGRFKNGLGEDEAVSGNDAEIRVQRAKSRLLLGIAKSPWRPHFDAELGRALVHCRPALALAASGWARRLCVDRNHIMARHFERIEAWHSEIR